MKFCMMEILHEVQTDSGEESWFSGIVISYNPENTHESLYDSALPL